MKHFLGIAIQGPLRVGPWGDETDAEPNTSQHVVALSYADAWSAWVRHCDWQQWKPVAVVEHPTGQPA